MEKIITAKEAKELISSIITKNEEDSFYIKRKKKNGDWMRIESDEIFKQWKENGYIKQSREDEIKEEIKSLYSEFYNISWENADKILPLYRELVEILDNKIKDMQQ
ncbi:unnamed protein product [marine sediment metagenome]|uniref:Uncharacterized protein n=1 Tax=marine sediment metagenome TaxID=412755 RepID=X1CYH5_9ZZZZ